MLGSGRLLRSGGGGGGGGGKQVNVEAGLSHPKEGGGDIKFWGPFNTAALSLNHTGGGGGHKWFQPFKRGARVKSVTVLRGGGGRKKLQTHDFSILEPPSP